MHDTHTDLRTEISKIIAQKTTSTDERLERVCQAMKAAIPHYDWVGFYFRHPKKTELHLRSFAGTPTDHTVIPFGKGICGQVALSNKNFVVPDVKAQDNYIACSLDVKSEIVIPLFKDGKNIGQIDIDSNTADPFTHADIDLLEWVNAAVAMML